MLIIIRNNSFICLKAACWTSLLCPLVVLNAPTGISSLLKFILSLLFPKTETFVSHCWTKASFTASRTLNALSNSRVWWFMVVWGRSYIKQRVVCIHLIWFVITNRNKRAPFLGIRFWNLLHGANGHKTHILTKNNPHVVKCNSVQQASDEKTYFCSGYKHLSQMFRVKVAFVWMYLSRYWCFSSKKGKAEMLEHSPLNPNTQEGCLPSVMLVADWLLAKPSHRLQPFLRSLLANWL